MITVKNTGIIVLFLMLLPHCRADFVYMQDAESDSDTITECHNNGSCQECLDCAANSACKDVVTECENDYGCLNLVECFVECNDYDTEQCIYECNDYYYSGTETFIAFVSCIYCDSCRTSCDAPVDCSTFGSQPEDDTSSDSDTVDTDTDDQYNDIWICDTDWYGSNDGCDCGCGIQDLDCFGLLAEQCEYLHCADDGPVFSYNNAICYDDTIDTETDTNLTHDNCIDLDDDGFGSNCTNGDDCDDADSAINPAALERYFNGKNDDCNEDTVDDAPEVSNDIGVCVTPVGHDSSTGTKEAPVATISRAIELAETQNKIVFISKGTYIGEIVTPVTLVGGYDPTTWTLDYSQNITYITSSRDEKISIETTGDYVAIKGMTFVLDRFGYNGGYNLTTTSIFVPEGTSATIANNTFIGEQKDPGCCPILYGIRIEGDALVVNNLMTYTADYEVIPVNVSETGRLVMVNNTTYQKSLVGVLWSNRTNATAAVSTNGYTELVNNVFVDYSTENGSERIVNVRGGNLTTIHNNYQNLNGDCLLWLDSFSDCFDLVEDINQCTWSYCMESTENTNVSAGFVDSASGDFHLDPQSVLIDSGINALEKYDIKILAIDRDGISRPEEGLWRPGAFEGSSTP